MSVKKKFFQCTMEEYFEIRINLDVQINTVKYLFFCETMAAIGDEAWPIQHVTMYSSTSVLVQLISGS